MPLLALLFAGLIGLVPWAQAAEGAPQAIPALTAPVMDVADLLPAPEEAHLNSRLLTFSKEKGSQIVILIVPTTQPEDIFSYSFRVAETWKPGRKGVDDGVVLVIAVQDRKTHLQVGYGLEGAIPDARAKQILQDIIRPYFKAGNYPAGIDAGVDAVITLINGEQLPPSDHAKRHRPTRKSGDRGIGYRHDGRPFSTRCHGAFDWRPRRRRHRPYLCLGSGQRGGNCGSSRPDCATVFILGR
jgi:uncharacterized protein